MKTKHTFKVWYEGEIMEMEFYFDRAIGRIDAMKRVKIEGYKLAK